MNIGVKRGMVVYGEDKLDEISLSAPTKICEFSGDKIKTYEITPEQFGMKRCKKEDLVGGEPKENAEITRTILKGEKGFKRDAVLLNAGAAFYINEKADSIEEGIRLAEDIIDSGKAYAKLEEFIKESSR